MTILVVFSFLKDRRWCFVFEEYSVFVVSAFYLFVCFCFLVGWFFVDFRHPERSVGSFNNYLKF